MTVVSAIYRNDYVGSGITGPYAYVFRIFAATDLAVVQADANGVQSILALTVDYTVTGVGNRTGGTVMLTAALPVGSTLSLQRAIPITQPASLRNQGDYFPETVEDALDRLTMIDQVLKDGIDRSFKVPSSIPPSGINTTISSFLPSYYLRVKSDGSGLEGVSTVASSQNFIQSGTGAVTRTMQSKAAEIFSVTDFGASPSASIATNTAAFQAAILACYTAGGGTVFVPRGRYAVTELNFLAYRNVILEGEGTGYNSDATFLPASQLYVTTGVWGIRFPQTSIYCGIKNLGILSNGILDDNAPHPVITPGVEYGVFIETGLTTMDGITVLGFQHGTVLACGGNSNIFSRCAFLFNTKTGFAVTSGGSYAFCHPNMTGPVSRPKTTEFTMANCNIRRNGWGMIIRDGIAVYNTVVMESNFFGGLMMYQGTDDDPVSGVFYNCYFENNWSSYGVAVAYTITQNTLLLDTAGVWMDWTLNSGDTALNDPGYQLYLMTKTGGAGVGVVQAAFYHIFIRPPLAGEGACTTSGKAMYIKSAYETLFYKGTSTAGDSTIVGTKANAVRLGDGTGTFTSNATHWWYYGGILPTDLGNKGARFDADHSNPGGGITAQGGYFRGLYGTPGTYTPTVDRDGTPVTCTYTTQTGTLVQFGNQVTVNIKIVIAGITGAGTGQNTVSLPAGFTPAAGVYTGVVGQNAAFSSTAVHTCQIEGGVLYFNRVGPSNQYVSENWAADYLTLTITYTY